MFLGTFGVGVLSQIMNLNNFILFVGTVGIPLGLTRFVSEWQKEGLWEDIKLIVGQCISLLLLISVCVILISAFLSKQISFLLFKDQNYYLLVLFLACSIPFTLVSSIFESLLRGLKKFGQYVIISIVVSLTSLVITIILVYYSGITGAVISLTFSSLIAVISYLAYFRKSNLLRLSNVIILNFNYTNKFKSIIKIGVASLIIGSVEQLTQIVIRFSIIEELGIIANGLYQSVFAISINYFTLLFMSLGIYLLPVLSETKERAIVNKEINSTLRLTLILIVPIISFIFVFREYIFLLFYTADFLPASKLLMFNFLGDFFKAFSWVIGAWLIPASRIKVWILFSMIYNFNYIFIFLALLKFSQFGLKSIVISYFIAYLIHSVLNVYFIIKYNEFKFSDINLKLFPFAISLLLIILTASSYKLILGYILLLPVLFYWTKLSITKEEFRKSCALVKKNILGDGDGFIPIK